MTQSGQPVLELVIFKLKEGIEHDTFLQESESITTWVKRQPGFISRSLSHDAKTGTYFDVVFWWSMDDAMTASKAAETSTECAPAFGMINMESVQIHHGVQQAEPVAA